jgi:hypothetical protein
MTSTRENRGCTSMTNVQLASAMLGSLTRGRHYPPGPPRLSRRASRRRADRVKAHAQSLVWRVPALIGRFASAATCGASWRQSRRPRCWPRAPMPAAPRWRALPSPTHAAGRGICFSACSVAGAGVGRRSAVALVMAMAPVWASATQPNPKDDALAIVGLVRMAACDHALSPPPRLPAGAPPAASKWPQATLARAANAMPRRG